MASPPQPPPPPPQHEDDHSVVITTGGGGGSNKDQSANAVVKGKRTKRQRPQSPIPFKITSTASTPLPDDKDNRNSSSRSDDGSDICSNVQDNINNSSPNNGSGVQNPPPPVPASSSDEYYNNAGDNYYYYSGATDEEEDMANCLILLSQGQSRSEAAHAPAPKQQRRPQMAREEVAMGSGSGSNKFSSRKFMEAPTTANGKAGYYVYECKTCSRAFPSFQALGGHRASHKKPRNINKDYNDYGTRRNNTNHNNNNNNNNNTNLVQASDDEDGLPLPSYETDNIVSNNSLSLQLSNRALFDHNQSSSSHNNPNNKQPRVHECSICGAEFSSGQALGGHMRRHRGGPNGGSHTTTAALSFTTAPVAAEPLSSAAPVDGVDRKQRMGEEEEKKRAALSLELDLNLPAPSEEDHHRQPNSNKNSQRESKPFHFASKQAQDHQQQQKQRISSSPATLVDCHY